MLAAWLHDLNPTLIPITETFGIRWYGIAYALGFVLGGWQLAWLASRGGSLIPRPLVYDALMSLVFGVILGGRLGYVLFYDPTLMTFVEKDFPWWGVLMINRGGMSFHGALLGLIAAAWYVSRRLHREGEPPLRLPFAHVCDLICFVVPPGLMLGRLANFVNGELLGRIVANPGQPAPWWSVKFPQEIAGEHTVPYTPEQAGRIVDLLNRFGAREHSIDFARGRLLAAIQNRGFPERERLLAEVTDLVSARHPSQLYQAIVEGPIIALVLWFLWRRPRRPGVVTGAFLVLYGVTRFVVEQYFRLPDPQLGNPRPGGLSRGQWLCAAMVVGGIAVVGVAARRGAEKLGGWGKRTIASPTM